MSKKSKQKKNVVINYMMDSVDYLLSKMGKGASEEDVRDANDFYQDSVDEVKDKTDLFDDDGKEVT